MIDSTTIIELTFRREDFEEIYFVNHEGNIFLSKTVKERFIILLVFICLFIISGTYSFFTNTLFGIPILSFFLLVIAGFSYRYYALPILKWKKNIDTYLKNLSQINNHAINLTPNSISVIQDGEEVIVKWVVITSAKITEKFITIAGTEIFFFPKKSMKDTDYQFLKNMVVEKIKNSQ